jgi:hypothetical protein
MKSNQVIKSDASMTWGYGDSQNDLSLVYFKPQIPEIKSYFLNQQKLKSKKLIFRANTLLIRTYKLLDLPGWS